MQMNMQEYYHIIRYKTKDTHHTLYVHCKCVKAEMEGNDGNEEAFKNSTNLK